tara:strand:- start:6362 stop:7078 length:717 start_codon:yes stop_codon:yes gene_type:complete
MNTVCKTISIIIPVYNEEQFIEEVIKRVSNSDTMGLIKEIIVIDDCSIDQSWQKISGLSSSIQIIKFRKNINGGKGSAIRKGISLASGDIILIQDADLEYNPKEFPTLLEPIINGNADVVYGSRFKTSKSNRVLYFWHRVANGILTILSNMFTNLNLTDMETGYKVLRKEIIDSLILCENSFTIEPEITAKIAKIKKVKIFEVGISYYGRTYDEGKKIGLKDAFLAVFTILKYGIFKK